MAFLHSHVWAPFVKCMHRPVIIRPDRTERQCWDNSRANPVYIQGCSWLTSERKLQPSNWKSETCLHHSIRDRGATHDRWTLRLRRWCFALTASQSWWMMSFYRAAADRIIIIMSLYYYYLPYYVLAVFICIAKCPWVTFKGAYKSK